MSYSEAKPIKLTKSKVEKKCTNKKEKKVQIVEKDQTNEARKGMLMEVEIFHVM